MRKAALIKSNGYLHCEMVYRVYALVHDISIVQNIQPNISSSDILCDKKKNSPSQIHLLMDVCTSFSIEFNSKLVCSCLSNEFISYHLYFVEIFSIIELLDYLQCKQICIFGQIIALGFNQEESLV